VRVGTGFVGRHDILEKIGRWCDGEVERPLIVTGPPGSGKTTLVKRLDEITRGLAQGLPDLGVGTFTFIHYCKANDDRSLDPIRFVEKLAQALTDRFPTFADAIFSDVPEIELNITQHIGSAVDSTVRSLEISHLALGERSHRVAYDRAVRARWSACASTA
jgi:energy-coupling factor transporter ATP-binding protein EcfA2